jgi:RNA polymerase sigma-70 factor (ECF subfamily)
VATVRSPLPFAGKAVALACSAVDLPAEDERWGATSICDRAALEGLYAELGPAIYRFLRDLLGDPGLALDATQETFTRAFRGIDGVPAETRLAPWVFGIARYVSLELRRARVRARRVIDDTGAPPPQARLVDTRARSPEVALLDREAIDVVARALEKLADDRRAVFLLRLDHGLSHKDIADSMGWSVAKVKVEIFRAREVLRATLEQYRGERS